jgi:hypothetical protein
MAFSRKRAGCTVITWSNPHVSDPTQQKRFSGNKQRGKEQNEAMPPGTRENLTPIDQGRQEVGD